MLRDTDPEVVRAVRASYYGMVEFEDQQIGIVYDAFQAYLKRNGREGIFVYVSDHGEQAGYRGYYGKGTFYEASSHIPMIFAGDGIAKGRVLQGATSLMDLGPTLCDLADTIAPPDMDGVSLHAVLTGAKDNTDRMVVSEVGGEKNYMTGEFYYGQMVKWKNYKLIHYDRYDEDDILYDLTADPKESMNVITAYPDIAQKMRNYLDDICKVTVEDIRKNAEKLEKNLKVLAKCSFDSTERWRAPECARNYPEHMVASKLKRS